VPEVVVTAQRTAALASRTPVAVSVVSGEQLRDLGAISPADIGPRLPNVHIDQAFSGLRVTIRGISNMALHAVKLFYATEESKEGVNAFNEKRKPDFHKFAE
jgi:1,4-dihydroxy-2-naphthoyl-CoA synthase